MKTKTVIVGATCFGIGKLLKNPEDVLIIERSASVGNEYFNAYRKCHSWDRELTSNVANGYKQRMQELGHLTENSADSYGLAPLLYKTLSTMSDKVMLTTEIENIKCMDKKFVLTVYNQSGKNEIICENIIDTTPECLTNRKWGRDNIVEKKLHCSLIGQGEFDEESLMTREGRDEQEIFAGIAIDKTSDWLSSRQKLLAKIQQTSMHERYKIASIAKEFDYELKENNYVFKENWCFVNPVAFNNPLEAIDSGYTS